MTSPRPAWITHGYYGCATGCCGHTVHVEGPEPGVFEFWHGDTREEAEAKIAEIARERGWGPVVLDWARCDMNEGSNC